jgi:hypothetical protein
MVKSKGDTITKKIKHWNTETCTPIVWNRKVYVQVANIVFEGKLLRSRNWVNGYKWVDFQLGPDVYQAIARHKTAA